MDCKTRKKWTFRMVVCVMKRKMSFCFPLSGSRDFSFCSFKFIAKDQKTIDVLYIKQNWYSIIRNELEDCGWLIHTVVRPLWCVHHSVTNNASMYCMGNCDSPSALPLSISSQSLSASTVIKNSQVVTELFIYEQGQSH